MPSTGPDAAFPGPRARFARRLVTSPLGRVLLVCLLALLVPRPAPAVQEWYDYYLQARNRNIPARDWTSCVDNVRQALRLRRRPAVNVQTYGLQFVDYLPHYLLGRCLLRQDKYIEALEAFDRSEQGGAAAKSPERAELARLRSEARSGESFGVLKLSLFAGNYQWEFVPVAGETFTDFGVGACHDETS